MKMKEIEKKLSEEFRRVDHMEYPAEWRDSIMESVKRQTLSSTARYMKDATLMSVGLMWRFAMASVILTIGFVVLFTVWPGRMSDDNVATDDIPYDSFDISEKVIETL